MKEYVRYINYVHCLNGLVVGMWKYRLELSIEPATAKSLTELQFYVIE